MPGATSGTRTGTQGYHGPLVPLAKSEWQAGRSRPSGVGAKGDELITTTLGRYDRTAPLGTSLLEGWRGRARGSRLPADP